MKLGTGHDLHKTVNKACEADWERSPHRRTWGAGLRLHTSRVLATEPADRDGMLRKLEELKSFVRTMENAVQSGEAQ